MYHQAPWSTSTLSALPHFVPELSNLAFADYTSFLFWSIETSHQALLVGSSATKCATKMTLTDSLTTLLSAASYHHWKDCPLVWLISVLPWSYLRLCLIALWSCLSLAEKSEFLEPVLSSQLYLMPKACGESSPSRRPHKNLTCCHTCFPQKVHVDCVAPFKFKFFRLNFFFS